LEAGLGLLQRQTLRVELPHPCLLRRERGFERCDATVALLDVLPRPGELALELSVLLLRDDTPGDAHRDEQDRDPSTHGTSGWECSRPSTAGSYTAPAGPGGPAPPSPRARLPPDPRGRCTR